MWNPHFVVVKMWNPHFVVAKMWNPHFAVVKMRNPHFQNVERVLRDIRQFCRSTFSCLKMWNRIPSRVALVENVESDLSRGGGWCEWKGGGVGLGGGQLGGGAAPSEFDPGVALFYSQNPSAATPNSTLMPPSAAAWFLS